MLKTDDKYIKKHYLSHPVEEFFVSPITLESQDHYIIKMHEHYFQADILKSLEYMYKNMYSRLISEDFFLIMKISIN